MSNRDVVVLTLVVAWTVLMTFFCSSTVEWVYSRQKQHIQLLEADLMLLEQRVQQLEADDELS